jgi:membrane protease YdiL (CAAX protease family)
MEEPVQTEPTVASATPPEIPAIPWTVRETWLGVLLLVLVLVVEVAAAIFLPRNAQARNIALVVLEPLFLLPVAIILGWKRVSWKHLGFRNFKWTALAFGCGTLFLVYPLILVHNAILLLLGVQTQGDSIVKALSNLGSPLLFGVASVILAPLVEEILFRGFIFAGFRQRYGWVWALVLSSAIFAASHLQLVAFIPTFILGAALAYAYQRSNSIWPGIFLHFLVNGMALLLILIASQMGVL